MTFTAFKAKWAAKLLKARYFVILTDKESAVAFEGVNPNDINDQIALAAQTAEVEQFYEQLGDLLKQHKRAMEDLTGANKTKKPTKRAKSKTV